MNDLHIITLYRLHNKLSCESSLSCRATRARRVEPCCSTSSTQPKCMGSTRRMCRVESSQVEFEPIRFLDHPVHVQITLVFWRFLISQHYAFKYNVATGHVILCSFLQSSNINLKFPLGKCESRGIARTWIVTMKNCGDTVFTKQTAYNFCH